MVCALAVSVCAGDVLLHALDLGEECISANNLSVSCMFVCVCARARVEQAYNDPKRTTSEMIKCTRDAAKSHASTDAKGDERGIQASVPRGVFCSKSMKVARNTPTDMSKGYSWPPESIPMVSGTFYVSLILSRFEPGSLSTFFSKTDVPIGGYRPTRII